MKAFPLILAGMLLALPSCDSLSFEEYTPEYLKETTPLDPPGTEAARAAMRQERVKEGKFETGSSVPVQQGRVFLLSRNPEYSPEPEGRLVEATEAKVLSCEGLYYFVELEDGKRGYLRESDFEQPVEPMAVDPMMAAGMFGPEGEGVVEGAAPIQLDENQTLTTNQDGRAVVLVGKKSDRAAEFEKRRKAVETGVPLPEAAPSSASGADEPPPLPEPAGDGEQ